MFQSFYADRIYLENKYHRTDEPFNPHRRRAYHGYEYDPATGLTDQQIAENLQELASQWEGLPHPVAKAKAIAYVLENTRIDVNEHDYFVGLYSWNQLPRETTLLKWKKEVFEEKIPHINQRMAQLNQSGAITIWPDFDHVVPDWESIVTLGLPGILQRARDYRKKHEANAPLTARQQAFFDGIEIEYTAIIAFVDRLYRYALTKSHSKAAQIAACLKQLRDGAPTNTYEAMQLMYLYFMISESVDSYQVRSLGNGLDNTLYSFYVRDLEQGTFTREQIREFLAYFMMQWSAIGNYWGQPFYMGGTDARGVSRINDLSHDIIEVYDALDIYNPKIQIKYTPDMPREFLNKILCMVRKSKSIVFCCEKGMMKAVMAYGATLEEARTMDIRGCYETGIRANEVCTGTNYVNALKAVSLVFTDGYDPATEQQVSIHTGDIATFQTFEDFYGAFLRQYGHLIEETVRLANAFEQYLEEINPSSLYSATIKTSLENAFDGYQGGVKFNNTALLNCGLATAVDAVMAVWYLVFEKKTVTLPQLKQALDANWEGYEALRLQALNCPYKYGNGNPLADSYAQAISSFFCNRVNGRQNARGGVYKANLHSALQFVKQGEKTGATPDGRKAGEETSKNGSPTPGMDRNGVTALIHSVTKLDPTSYMESCCLDVMLHPSAVEGEDGLVAMKALLDVYTNRDGMSLQFNVFNAATLRDAQLHPERYKNLQVRVCGWNVLWNNLSRAEQDAYILRAESIQ